MSIPPLDYAPPPPAAPLGGADAREGADTTPNPPPATAPAPSKPSEDAVKVAIAALNDALKANDRAVEFSVDHDTGEVVVTLVDTETHSVLRQVPSQELLEIAKSLDQQQLLLLRNRA